MTYKQKCVRLFFITIYISSVAFGGGYVVLGMLRQYFVKKYKWMTDDEMTVSIAIAQTAPGAIAGNAAMLVGYNIAGVFGAFITMTASIIPPLVIITIVSIFYNTIRDNIIVDNILRAMRAGVVAVIISISIDMIVNVTKKGKNITAIVIMASAFIASYFIKIQPIYIILIAALCGIALSYIRLFVMKKGNEADK
jgi:chromate transporter